MRADNTNYRITCANDSAEIFLYDVIGEGFFGGISAKQFAQDLRAAKNVKTIDLHINSPGGSVFEGNTMFNLLKQHPAKINGYIDGVAASIASVIAMAADNLQIAQNGRMMIHDPMGFSDGTSADHRKVADLLDSVRDDIVQAYVSKSGQDAEMLSAMMMQETWLTAEQCLHYGLCDSCGKEMAIAACIDSKLFNYKKTPAELAGNESPKILSYEEALRERIKQSRSKAI